MIKQTTLTVNQALNEFAKRSFRDSADRDYITARMAYRAALFQPFYWSALQALEKYLKGILLFNRVPAPDISHELKKLLDRGREGLPFELRLSDDTRDLVGLLDDFGPNRYLEGSYSIVGYMLLRLDRAVWQVRRYCRVMDYVLELPEGPKHMLPFEVAACEAASAAPPQRFHVPGGLLEKIIDDREHPAREPLLWQNGYYGTRRRRKVSQPAHGYAENAPLTLHPYMLDEVVKYVRLPKRWREAYRELLNEQRAQSDRAQGR